MTDKERSTVMEMIVAINTDFAVQDEVKVKTIRDTFIRDFTVDVTREPEYVLKLLEAAYLEKNSGDVEFSITIAGSFNLISKDYVSILMKLIETDWHYMHEDIASIFQTLKSSNTVDCLYRTALRRFKYLDYDDAYALAVKCIWALGDINTIASKTKLELLAQSDNQVIKDNAIYQLNRLAI